MIGLPLVLPPAIRVPAETAPHREVLMSWSTYDPARGQSVHAVQRAIARAIQRVGHVTFLVRDEREESSARRLLGDTFGISFRRSANAEIWVRDFGPTFVETPTGPKVATYGFDFWSYDRVGGKLSAPEDRVDGDLARAYDLPTISSRLVSEGGNRESNGAGEALMTWSVEKRRNPGLTRLQIEREHARVLGFRKIYWVPEGGAEDDLTMDGPLPGNVYTCVTTGGHVDNVARWAADGRTVLLAEVTEAQARRSPIAAISRMRYEANAAALRKTGLRIVRVPTPDVSLVTLRPGDGTYDFIAGLKYRKPFPKGRPVKVVPAGSYLNFIVCNGLVLVSSFGGPNDARARAVLQSAFPEHRIEMIPTMPLALGGGGIHCITQPVWAE